MNEIEQIIEDVSYNVHCNDKQAIAKAISQHVLKARNDGYREGRDYIINLHKDYEIKARIEELENQTYVEAVYFEERIQELKNQLQRV